MKNLQSIIESILFVADRPVSSRDLARLAKASEDEVKNALAAIQSGRQGSGILLLEQNGKYMLSTSPESAEEVKDFLNSELREKLSDASLETLAIVCYKQPVSRAEIESIRGVNSQYTLRLLTMRGLVEKSSSSSDLRVALYRTTHEFLQHLGISSVKDLPDFEELTAKVKPPEGFAVTEAPAQTSKE